MKFDCRLLLYALEFAFKQLRIFSREQRENIDRMRATTLFPTYTSIERPWVLEDASTRTFATEPFHGLVICIHVSARRWEKNILLLIATKKMKLVDGYKIQHRHWNMHLPELKEHMDTLTKFIPKKILTHFNPPIDIIN